MIEGRTVERICCAAHLRWFVVHRAPSPSITGRPDTMTLPPRCATMRLSRPIMEEPVDTEVAELKKEVAALRARVETHEELIGRLVGLSESNLEAGQEARKHISTLLALNDFSTKGLLLEFICLDYLLKRQPFSSKKELKKQIEENNLLPSDEELRGTFDRLKSRLLDASTGSPQDLVKEILGHLLPLLRNIHLGQ